MSLTISNRVATTLAGLVMLLMLSVTASSAEIVYVPLGSDDKIVVIDPNEDRVIDEITGLPAIHGLAGTPDGRYLIAGSMLERDPDGGPPEMPVGMSEQEHASHHQSPPKDADNVGPTVSVVTVIKTADRTILSRIVVPGSVHHVAASPDSRFALVTHPNQSMVSVIELATYTLLATIETGPLPNYAVFGRDGSRAYVSNAGNNTITEIDISTWTARRNIPAGASPEHIVVSRDGETLYVNNVDDGMVSAIDLELGNVQATYAVGPNPHGIDTADDGGTLFVASRDDDTLVSINTQDGTMRSITLSPSPYHLATIRGTGKVYISSAEEPKIWVVDQANFEVVGEIQIGGRGHQIVQGVGG